GPPGAADRRRRCDPLLVRRLSGAGRRARDLRRSALARRRAARQRRSPAPAGKGEAMTNRRFAASLVLALVAAATPALAADGAKVFADRCATCHGKTGAAHTPAAKMMKAPALAGDAKVAAMPAADLVAAIKANPKHASMIKSLGDDDLTAVAAYVAGLAGKH